MHRLHLASLSLPGVALGPENPLPSLVIRPDLHVFTAEGNIPADMQRNMTYGHVADTLPYTTQDGYTRERQPRDYRVAVLENDLLRATFLLDYGGRLWSLRHKPSGRELLYVNPVFQPANLALRNAWFSGGVEWNIGTIGHSPFTCAPLFAARVLADDGTPVLRLYEWERIRQVAFQIDAWLPDGSPLLYIRCRITSAHAHTIPMYWWSNIAVPESSATRVIVPAERAYRFGYEGEGLRSVPFPDHDSVDRSYSTRSQRALDYFFHIPDGQRPWIAALDGDGAGLVQLSTPRLQGRKLFLWGTGPGGQAWQRWLSGGQEPPYIEIQAGLARTQLEHLPMPAGADWSWLEGYGLLEADPAAVHSDDWAQAHDAVTTAVEALAPAAAFDAAEAQFGRLADRAPVEILARGSGWGALERLRRQVEGEPPFCSSGLVFDDESLTDAQTPWLTLLREGHFPTQPVDAPPAGYLVQAQWHDRLEAALAQDPDAGWAAWLHLGVMRYHAGDHDAAQDAWRRSLAQAATPWAQRNLAVLAAQQGDTTQAAELLVQAQRMRPDLLPLALETGRALLAADRPQDWLDLLAELSPDLQTRGRVRLLEAQAALAVDDLARVEALLASRTIIPDDLREGEETLNELWFAYHEQRLSQATGEPVDEALRAHVRREHPVPPEFDFRMRE